MGWLSSSLVEVGGQRIAGIEGSVEKDESLILKELRALGEKQSMDGRPYEARALRNRVVRGPEPLDQTDGLRVATKQNEVYPVCRA